MSLYLEKFREYFPPHSLLLFARSESDDAIVDVPDRQLEQANSKRAEEIATALRDSIGIYRFGPMWAEYRVQMPDKRNVWLQASKDALVIHLDSVDGSPAPSIHARWNRTHQLIHSYEERLPDLHLPQFFYELPNPENPSPLTITPWHISRDFGSIMEQIEQVTLSKLS